MKQMLKRTFGGVLLLGLATILGACGLFSPGADNAEPTPVPTVMVGGTVSAVGRTAPVRYAVLAPAVGGVLLELPAAEGDVVLEGDVLARLGDLQAQDAALAQAKAEQLAARQGLQALQDTADLARASVEQEAVQARAALAEAIHALSQLDTTAFRDRLDDKNVALTKAQDKLDDAREELDKHVDLDPTNYTRKRAQTAYDKADKALADAVYARDSLQSELDLAQAAVSLAAEQVADVERRVDATGSGPDVDQLALARARVAFADAGVAAAEHAIELAVVTAPYAGEVVDLHDMETGLRVAAGTPLVTLADTTMWVVETTDLTELDVVSVSVGQKASVVADALPDLTLVGTVESIAAVPVERSGDVLYAVRIRLDEGDARLRWGMTVDVTLAE